MVVNSIGFERRGCSFLLPNYLGGGKKRIVIQCPPMAKKKKKRKKIKETPSHRTIWVLLVCRRKSHSPSRPQAKVRLYKAKMAEGLAQGVEQLPWKCEA
jgi:hypothetical protein